MMKHSFSLFKMMVISSVTTVLLSTSAFAQAHDNHATPTMPTHDMSKMDHSKMDHSNMPQSRPADMMVPRATHMVEARGTVRRINVAKREVTLQHGAIAQVSWPAAVMIFPVGTTVDLNRLTPGQPVQFTLHRAPNGGLPLVELCPAQSAGIIPGLCASSMDHQGMDHDAMDHGVMTQKPMMPQPMMDGGMTHDGHTMPATRAPTETPAPATPMNHAAHGDHD